MKVSEVMTPNVETVQPDQTVQQAASFMLSADAGSIPVTEGDRLIGMITDRDIAVRGVADMRDAGRMPVGSVMTDEAFACHAGDSLYDCMRAMARHQVRRIPIVDGRDRVVGIVSQADIAQHAGDLPGHGERRAVADVVCAVSEPTDQPYR